MIKKTKSIIVTQKEKIPKELNSEDWYQGLIEECKAIIVESAFNARWTLVEGYHQLGERILKENNNFQRAEIYGQKITQRVAASLNKSQRTIEQAIQFVKKYPDLDKVPEGKNINWRKIVNKYLPSYQEGTETECIHPESKIKEISFLKCKECGKSLETHCQIPIKDDIINHIKNWAESHGYPKFPLEFNEEGIPFSFIQAGKEDWLKFLNNKIRTLPELWKIWKRNESSEM